MGPIPLFFPLFVHIIIRVSSQPDLFRPSQRVSRGELYPQASVSQTAYSPATPIDNISPDSHPPLSSSGFWNPS